MSAYANRQRLQSGQLLSLEPRPSRRELSTSPAVSVHGTDPNGADAGPTIDALLNRLADRVAEAVIARLGGSQEQQDEWLDSRQAATYLGMHRDTLRRLAAARAVPAEQDGRGCRLFFRRKVLDEWRRSGGRSRHLRAIEDAA